MSELKNEKMELLKKLSTYLIVSLLGEYELSH